MQMYSGNDLQAVQLLQGGNCSAVSSNAGNWTQTNSSTSTGRGSKGTRSGQSSKGTAGTTFSMAPSGRQVTYIDTTLGSFVSSTGSQKFGRPPVPQQSVRTGKQSACAQLSSAVAQVQGFQLSGQQPQQVLQMQSLPAPNGAHVYQLTNGTRVVKAGQPYPNTTIVQTAVAVPANVSQSQGPQQQMGVITLRQQNISPQALQVQQQVLQPSQVQGMQVSMGGALQQQQPQQQQHQLQQQQLQQQQPGQQAKVTLLQAPSTAQPHVLVAQPQQQFVQPTQQSQQQPQQQTQQLQAKQQHQQRQANSQGTFQAVTGQPAGSAGAGGTASRAGLSGPIPLQNLFAPPATVTTIVRPAVRIPKLGTVATYNPVTGVRSVTTIGGPGGTAVPLMPANLPATLMQHVHKANIMQQQHQQAAVVGTNGTSAGVKAILAAHPQLQSQAIRPIGHMTALVSNPATIVGTGCTQQQQRQAALVVPGESGVGSGGACLTTAVQPPSTHISVVGSALHSQQQQQLAQAGHHIHIVSAAGGSQLQQLLPQQTQQQDQLQTQQLQAQHPQQQQLVNITLADGTTATTVMDQATLTRMLSESSRGQAAKLQQQQQEQQQQQRLNLPVDVVGAGSLQAQLHLLPLQQQERQQVLLQPAPQRAGPGVLAVLGTGGSSCGKGPAGGSGSSGLEQLGGLQTVHLQTADNPSSSVMNGPAHLLIRAASQMGASGSAGCGPPPPSGLTQVGHIRGVQLLGPTNSLSSLGGNLQQVDILSAGQPAQQSLQHQHLLHLHLQQQQQLVSGRRSPGQGLPGDGESGVSRIHPSAMAIAQFKRLHSQQQQQQQQQGHFLQQQQQRQLSSMFEGLSVVDLDGVMTQQQQQQQQMENQPQRLPQHTLGGVSSQRPQPSAGMANAGGAAVYGFSGVGAGSTFLSTALTSGRLDGVGGGNGLMLPIENLAMGSNTPSGNIAPVGNSAVAVATPFGGVGINGSGSSREDFKAILVSIGQELARHGISVETAVTFGWLGVLAAMDVAVLADAYTEEERRLMIQGKTQQQQQPTATQLPPQYRLQQPQQAVAAQAAGQNDNGRMPPQPPATTVVGEMGLTSTSGATAAGSSSRSGSSGERGSGAAATILGVTSSSARTSMSVAPSEDGGSTVSGGADTGSGHAAGVGAGGSCDGGHGSVYDLTKLNAFQLGFLGAGVLSNLGGDISADLERLRASELDRDYDSGAMAQVLGENPWPTFGMPLMAEEIGLSAQPDHRYHRHSLLPRHAPVLMRSWSGAASGKGCGVDSGAGLIDSASEYEAQMPAWAPLQQQQQQQQRLMAQQHEHPQLLLQQQTGVTVGRFASAELPSRQLSCETSSHGGGGSHGSSSGGGATKGHLASAASNLLAASEASRARVDMDKDIKNRFANLDLGCGFC